MKNLVACVHNAKNKITADFSKNKTAWATGMIAALAVAPGYCADANTMARNVLTKIFGAAMFGGIVILIAGVVMVVSNVMKGHDGGEQVQWGKVIGTIVTGIILIALKAIVTSVMGSDPTSGSFF